MPEKILDQVKGHGGECSEDFPYDTLKSRLRRLTLCPTMRSWISSTNPSLWGAGSLPRCWPACWLTVPLAWSRPHHVPCTCSYSGCLCLCGTCLGNRILAARADRLWATHKPQSHDLVASVVTAEDQPAQIAAVLVASGLLVLVALLSLSRLRLDLESVSIIGLGRARKCEVPCSRGGGHEREISNAGR